MGYEPEPEPESVGVLASLSLQMETQHAGNFIFRLFLRWI